MTDQPQPPRLQDTTERSALPLPLPGTPGEGPVYAARGEQPEFAAPSQEPAPAEESTVVSTGADAVAFAAASAEDSGGEPEPPTEESDAVPEVDPEAPAPLPDDPEPVADGGESDDGQPDLDPLFAPPAADGVPATKPGPAPEVLVGAAFLGGVALAFLLKRLGS